MIYIPVPRQFSINYFRFSNESNNTFKMNTFKLGFFTEMDLRYFVKLFTRSRRIHF